MINHGTRTIKSCAVDVASVFFDVMVVELVTVPDLVVPDVFVKNGQKKRETSELRHVTRSSVVSEPVVAVKQYGDSATAFWNPHGVFKYWWRFVGDTGKHRVKRCVTTQVHALCHRQVTIQFVLANVSAREMRREVSRCFCFT